ncbi:hypothetical protein HK405_012522 [Cladochytrium tenue]|nr:hypothetical protein HK405_012522 [Cladochytrium tenue]
MPRSFVLVAAATLAGSCLTLLAGPAAVLAAPAPAPATATCGSQVYDTTQYTCTDGMLCPTGTVACGTSASFACYSPSLYHCVSGTLAQGAATSTTSTSTTSTTSKTSTTTSVTSTSKSSTTTTAATTSTTKTSTTTTSVTATSSPISCGGAFLGLQITSAASAYLENVWVWTADHELDRSDHSQVSIYTGRGMLVQSSSASGAVWMYGTAVEHNQLYNYQLSGARNVFMGLIQTETPYYQATPVATTPFVPGLAGSSWNDPTFSTCTTSACEKAWGLRIVNSQDVLVYGAGLYSFFDDYTQTCIASNTCQTNIASVENSTRVNLFALTTIGTTNLVTLNGVGVAPASANTDVYGSTLVRFTPSPAPETIPLAARTMNDHGVHAAIEAGSVGGANAYEDEADPDGHLDYTSLDYQLDQLRVMVATSPTLASQSTPPQSPAPDSIGGGRPPRAAAASRPFSAAFSLASVSSLDPADAPARSGSGAGGGARLGPAASRVAAMMDRAATAAARAAASSHAEIAAARAAAESLANASSEPDTAAPAVATLAAAAAETTIADIEPPSDRPTESPLPPRSPPRSPPPQHYQPRAPKTGSPPAGAMGAPRAADAMPPGTPPGHPVPPLPPTLMTLQGSVQYQAPVSRRKDASGVGVLRRGAWKKMLGVVCVGWIHVFETTDPTQPAGASLPVWGATKVRDVGRNVVEIRSPGGERGAAFTTWQVQLESGDGAHAWADAVRAAAAEASERATRTLAARRRLDPVAKMVAANAAGRGGEGDDVRGARATAPVTAPARRRKASLPTLTTTTSAAAAAVAGRAA